MSPVLKIAVFMLLLVLCACVPGSHTAKSEMRRQAEVHHKMAVAHISGNEITAALRELLIAVEQDPQNSSIQVLLAQTYQRKKAYALAEKHYLLALELSVDEPRYQHNFASLYLDMQQWDKAISYFDLAANNLLFDDAHVSITGKAYAYYKNNDLSAALKYANEALEIVPRYASASFLKSEIYEAMGDFDQQEINLHRTVNLAPQSMRARYKLALLMAQNNSLDEAKEQIEIILEFAPTSEIGYQAKKLLESFPAP
ncbi:MAG: tetratricopeptide repeat protein [Desulfuromonadales bacterium]|nr:tetratricopeptide repeat protein [Desulfuromonadales bacterium]